MEKSLARSRLSVREVRLCESSGEILCRRRVMERGNYPITLYTSYREMQGDAQVNQNQTSSSGNGAESFYLKGCFECS